MSISQKPLFTRKNRKYDRHDIINEYFKLEKHGFVFDDAIKLGISVTTLSKILTEAGIPFIKMPKRSKAKKSEDLIPVSTDIQQAREVLAVKSIKALCKDIKDQYGKYVYSENGKNEVFKELEDLLQYMTETR